MVKKTEQEIKHALEKINWNFDDYSSAKYPLDLNSIPWYPATFPAPIPKYLIALLSEQMDTIFDPFGGKGTTAVETLKQRRRYIYNDLNPHAVMIMKCLQSAINQDRNEFEMNRVVEEDRKYLSARKSCVKNTTYARQNETDFVAELPKDIVQQLEKRNIKSDVIYWFHGGTLRELLVLFDYINQYTGIDQDIRKLAFISILKEVCSQRGHFSYVTDNCRPSEMKYYDAITAYINMLDRIERSCLDFVRQYRVINKTCDLQMISQECVIHAGNAKNCSYIQDESVDLIITSPPYLCAQDYILTMRLNDFFYQEEGFIKLPFTEIGPRRLRTRNGIVDSYFNDMSVVFSEMKRVLKRDAYFCLIIGEGKGKVSEGINVTEKLLESAEQTGLSQIHKTTRNISFRTNRIGKVTREDLILLKKE